jgi:hypothetical protein
LLVVGLEYKCETEEVSQKVRLKVGDSFVYMNTSWTMAGINHCNSRRETKLVVSRDDKPKGKELQVRMVNAKDVIATLKGESGSTGSKDQVCKMLDNWTLYKDKLHKQVVQYHPESGSGASGSDSINLITTPRHGRATRQSSSNKQPVTEPTDDINSQKPDFSFDELFKTGDMTSPRSRAYKTNLQVLCVD